MVAGCVCILAILICMPIFAQDESDEEEEVIDIGEIHVEESLLETEEVIDRPTAMTTVLDPEELSRRSITLAEALETVPGVSIRSFGGLGALSTISIRGLGSENVLVLLDGIPLNPTGGTVDLSDIPLGSLERIEVIRGGEGALTGAGAVGGVVRLTGKAPGEEEGPSYTGRLSVGSFGIVTGGFTWLAPGNIFHIEGAGSRGDFNFLNDNGTSMDAADDFIDTRINNEFSSFQARYGHRWEFGNAETLGFSAEWYRAVKGIPGITTFPSPDASQTDTRLFIATNYTIPGWNSGELSINASWLRQGRHFADPLGQSTGVPLLTSWIHSRWDGKVEWSGAGWGDEDVLMWGVSAACEKLDDVEWNNPDRDTLSAWLRDEWYTESGAVLNGAMRCDWIDGDATVSTLGGIRYPLSETVTARSSLSYDFRPPSFEELYRNEGLVVGNPDLTDERTLGFDIGLTQATDNFRLEAAYFNLQTTDLIDYLLISGFRWQPHNIGRIRSSGVELSADWLIDSEWELSGTYTRTRAIDTSGDPVRQGQPLVGQPSSNLYFKLRWHDDAMEIFADFERRGPSAITPSGSRFLGADESVNFGTGYTFGNGESLLFEIKNALGDDLTDVRGFPLPGRSYFLTWSGEW
jgi:outer membrane cobalamin receptor